MITVGAALSLSGRFSLQGTQARDGLLLWVEDVNAAGGLRLGPRARPRRLELTILDDRGLSAEAAALTEHLILDERVDLLFGPYSSVLALATAPVAERHARLLWNHGGSSDALTERGYRYVVSILAPASRYFVPLLEMVRATRPDARRLALVHGAAGTFPRAVIGGAEAQAGRLGFEVVLRAPYPAEPAAMEALAAAVAATRPDLVLGAGTTEADLGFARAWVTQGLHEPLVGLVAAPMQAFRRALGADADGFLGPSQWEPDAALHPDVGPTSAEFVARFRRRFGIEPDYPAAQAYAAGLIAARCAELAGSLDDAAPAAIARRLSLTTFYGAFRLDEAGGGQVGHQVVVVQWQGGVKRVVWPPGSSARAVEPVLV